MCYSSGECRLLLKKKKKKNYTRSLVEETLHTAAVWRIIDTHTHTECDIGASKFGASRVFPSRENEDASVDAWMENTCAWCGRRYGEVRMNGYTDARV